MTFQIVKLLTQLNWTFHQPTKQILIRQIPATHLNTVFFFFSWLGCSCFVCVVVKGFRATQGLKVSELKASTCRSLFRQTLF